jgi:hypothetical protein
MWVLAVLLRDRLLLPSSSYRLSVIAITCASKTVPLCHDTGRRFEGIRMSGSTGFVSVIARNLFWPIATELRALEAAEKVPPNKLQTNGSENGHALAVVVLVVSRLMGKIRSTLFQWNGHRSVARAPGSTQGAIGRRNDAQNWPRIDAVSPTHVWVSPLRPLAAASGA